MNPAKCIPIEQSYIDLAIVESREQQTREKKLSQTKLIETVWNTFEEIYGVNSVADTKSVFRNMQRPT